MTLISLDERSKEESAMFEARRITSTQAKPLQPWVGCEVLTEDR
jgi:hypothetical protein